MEDTRHKPTDEVFADIQNAAMNAWIFYGRRTNDDTYIKDKIRKIEATENYAANWSGIVQMLDETKQILFLYNLKLQATVDFMKAHAIHYRIATPRELI